MLDRVIPTRFDRRMSSGKTWPCLLSCRRANGDEVEVVAKFSAACERRLGGLVAEAIGAMLAADLGLPIPEPVLVAFDRAFVDLIRLGDDDLAKRAQESAGVAFGSLKLPPGFASLPRGRATPRALRSQAAEVFAFDALIQNPDRRPENPNCLSDGRTLAIFDHELAFMTRGIIGWRPPWETGGLDPIKRPSGHVFFADLRGKQPPNLDRLKEAWHAITNVRLDEYRSALPAEWGDARQLANEILDYVARVRDNADSAFGEIERVLK
jgi:hypothetical protein